MWYNTFKYLFYIFRYKGGKLNKILLFIIIGGVIGVLYFLFGFIKSHGFLDIFSVSFIIVSVLVFSSMLVHIIKSRGTSS